MNTFAIGSLPVHFSVAKLFTFRWQYTLERVASKEDRENYIDIAALLIRKILNPVPKEPVA